MSKLIQGYVRAEVPLNVLDTSVNKSSTSPLAGVLEISTENGVLHLAISGDAAKDLKMDLDQSLAEEMSAGRKRFSGVAAKRTTTTSFDFPHIIEAQKCLDHPVRHSVADNNVRSRVLQVHKLSRWLFSEALPPIGGNRVVSDHNPPAATRAL